jgi:glycine/D-amino acid oxidase-like deaminating enzyme
MTTHKRDLRTGEPIWRAYKTRSLTWHDLTSNLETEILIVGAGISGALLGELLSADKHKVIMIDRRKPISGSTAASTSLAQYEIDQPLTCLARQIGKDNAVRAWRRSQQALAGLAARTKEIGCPFDYHDSLYLAGNMLNAKQLQAEEETRRAAGLETLYLARKTLEERFGVRRAGALLSYNNIGINPAELSGFYIRAAQENGLQLFSPVEITDVKAKQNGIKARTKSGHIIRCKYLIFCTGYELPDVVPCGGHKIVSTYAMATKPQKKNLWPEECFIWEASDPYLYMRTTKDGRIIIGGEDVDFSNAMARDKLLPRKTATLEKKLKKLFPHIEAKADYAWTGSFGITDTGLPRIGEIPGIKNCWAVLGYGGNGITYSRLAAEIIRTALAGGKDPESDLYAFV